MANVKVFDFATKTINEIPEAELAPGMIQMTIPPHGTVWANAETAYKLGKSPYRHAKLDPALRKRIKALAKCFRDATQDSADQWEDSFRRDTHPEQQIAIWESLVPLYVRFAREAFSRKKKQEIYNLLAHCLSTPLESIPGVVQYDELTQIEVARIIEAYSGASAKDQPPEVEAMQQKVIDLLRVDTLDEARKLIESPQVIRAVNPDDESDSTVLFGRKILEGIVSGSIPPQRVKTVVLPFKPDSEECELVQAFILAVRGKEE